MFVVGESGSMLTSVLAGNMLTDGGFWKFCAGTSTCIRRVWRRAGEIRHIVDVFSLCWQLVRLILLSFVLVLVQVPSSDEQMLTDVEFTGRFIHAAC